MHSFTHILQRKVKHTLAGLLVLGYSSVNNNNNNNNDNNHNSNRHLAHRTPAVGVENRTLSGVTKGGKSGDHTGWEIGGPHGVGDRTLCKYTLHPPALRQKTSEFQCRQVTSPRNIP